MAPGHRRTAWALFRDLLRVLPAAKQNFPMCKNLVENELCGAANMFSTSGLFGNFVVDSCFSRHSCHSNFVSCDQVYLTPGAKSRITLWGEAPRSRCLKAPKSWKHQKTLRWKFKLALTTYHPVIKVDISSLDQVNSYIAKFIVLQVFCVLHSTVSLKNNSPFLGEIINLISRHSFSVSVLKFAKMPFSPSCKIYPDDAIWCAKIWLLIHIYSCILHNAYSSSQNFSFQYISSKELLVCLFYVKSESNFLRSLHSMVVRCLLQRLYGRNSIAIGCAILRGRNIMDPLYIVKKQ